MKIHEMKQGSIEWLAIRAKFPTASEFGNILTPAKLQVSKSMGAYVARKLAEKWLGFPIQSFDGSGAMDQGSVRESEARPWYAFEYEVEIATPGFIVNQDPAPAGYPVCGCSPDGLIVGGDCGLEIKCPQPDTHVKYLLAGGLPDDYRLQVQGSMFVTGYERWTFLSYCPRFPQLVVDVPRDNAVCDAIGEALEEYWELFNDGWARLIAANGGHEPEPPVVNVDPEALAAFKEYVGGGQ
jgi:hypothetical protein